MLCSGALVRTFFSQYMHFILYTALIKEKTKFSSYIGKFRWDQVQSHIWGRISIWGNAQIFSPYMRRSSVIYDFATDPSEFPKIWGKFYFLFYQCRQICRFICLYLWLFSSLNLSFISTEEKGMRDMRVSCSAGVVPHSQAKFTLINVKCSCYPPLYTVSISHLRLNTAL